MNKTNVADVALKVILALAFAWGAWETRKLRGVAEEANRHSAENNVILRERDFNRLYVEHEQHHREHAEILRRCAP